MSCSFQKDVTTLGKNLDGHDTKLKCISDLNAARSYATDKIDYNVLCTGAKRTSLTEENIGLLCTGAKRTSLTEENIGLLCTGDKRALSNVC